MVAPAAQWRCSVCFSAATAQVPLAIGHCHAEAMAPRAVTMLALTEASLGQMPEPVTLLPARRHSESRRTKGAVGPSVVSAGSALSFAYLNHI